MKVLLLMDGLRPGGKERRLIELIKGLSSYHDIELHLVVFSEQVHFQEVYEFGIPITILKRVPKKNPMVLYRLYKICKSWQPDIIHSWSSMCTILAIPSSLFLRIKIINGNIANAPDNFKFFDQRLIRAKFTFLFSRVIVGNSLAGLKAYNAPKNKSVCIYNGFDINRISSNLKKEIAVKEEFRIKTDKVIGMVGGFYGKKDYKTYIEAALLVFKKRDDVSFIAVGGGPELSHFKTLIPQKYASRFIFTDVQRDVESIVNIFNVGVLSTYTEGISNALLEYMALRKPTIATIGGGTPETVVDNETGYLIPSRSPKELASKIVFLIENPSLITKMGNAGRERLENMFGLEKMTSAFYNLYTDISKN